MPRREIDITIDVEGRDKGKAFHLREMSAMAAEKWAARALLALVRSGIEVPDDIAQAGIAGLATLGFRAFSGVSFGDAEPLMDEMMGCVTIVPDPKRPAVTRQLIEDDLEEVATILRLREEVLSLHLGFSLREYRSKLASRPSTADNTSNTGISLAPSVPSSAVN